MEPVERIELELSRGLTPTADERPRMDELPPVRLVAVDDVRLVMPAGVEAALDELYVEALEFWNETEAGGRVYRGENFRLRFEVAEQMPLLRDGVRPIGIAVPSLRDLERKLFEAEIEYTRQRGLLPGLVSLLLQDAAGNWVEIFEGTK